jgi:hypothetical protein
MVQLVESSRSEAKIQPVFSIAEEVFLRWGDGPVSSQANLLQLIHSDKNLRGSGQQVRGIVCFAPAVLLCHSG